jgi:hypothetical protein
VLPDACLDLVKDCHRRMPPVASNLQITTNYGPAVNARG